MLPSFLEASAPSSVCTVDFECWWFAMDDSALCAVAIARMSLDRWRRIITNHPWWNTSLLWNVIWRSLVSLSMRWNTKSEFSAQPLVAYSGLALVTFWGLWATCYGLERCFYRVLPSSSEMRMCTSPLIWSPACAPAHKTTIHRSSMLRCSMPQLVSGFAIFPVVCHVKHSWRVTCMYPMSSASSWRTCMHNWRNVVCN